MPHSEGTWALCGLAVNQVDSYRETLRLEAFFNSSLNKGVHDFRCLPLFYPPRVVHNTSERLDRVAGNQRRQEVKQKRSELPHFLEENQIGWQLW